MQSINLIQSILGTILAPINVVQSKTSRTKLLLFINDPEREDYLLLQVANHEDKKNLPLKVNAAFMYVNIVLCFRNLQVLRILEIHCLHVSILVSIHVSIRQTQCSCPRETECDSLFMCLNVYVSLRL